MSNATGSRIELTGTGAAYIRASTDKQETDRQTESVNAFLNRHDSKIAGRYWFEDHGWSRDTADHRPEFQNLLKLVEGGGVRWVVVDRLDRFGTKDSHQLVHYLYRLREWKCKLFDSSGKEWTGEDIATVITVVVEGAKSKGEQTEKSHRSLGGMIEKARAGAWLGGPPKLGFDIGCLDRVTKEEQWRVVWEGREQRGTVKRKGKMRPAYHVLRRKVYPDGRTDRFDGGVVFRTSKETQVMRIVPTRDGAKLDAAKGVFTRYATEAVTFFDLAKWLNGLGIRNSLGGMFQGNCIRKMLSDEVYLGYATFGKRRNGRIKRYDATDGIVDLEEELRGKDTESDPEDVIRSERLFDPIIDRPTWDAVQKKLRGRKKRGNHSPKNPNLYFAGLVVCAGCGAPMIARTDRMEYHCATRDKHRARGTLSQSPCERNGVSQDVLEEYTKRYLAETGKRLELIRQKPGTRLTENLKGQQTEAWGAYCDGVDRLISYLARLHPTEYAELMRQDEERKISDMESIKANWHSKGAAPGDLVKRYGKEFVAAAANALKSDAPPLTPYGFVADLLSCYRTHFDPTGLEAEIARLEAEHDTLRKQCLKLTDQRAIKKTNEELSKLTVVLEELERQKEDASGVVMSHYRALQDLSLAIVRAQQEFSDENGEHALRQKAEALRGVICRIDCEFVVTGMKASGPGNSRSKLVALHFRPIAGDAIILPVDGPRNSDGGYRYQGKP